MTFDNMDSLSQYMNEAEVKIIASPELPCRYDGKWPDCNPTEKLRESTLHILWERHFGGQFAPDITNLYVNILCSSELIKAAIEFGVSQDFFSFQECKFQEDGQFLHLVVCHENPKYRIAIRFIP